MSELLGLVGFALVGTGTPGPNNALLWASGVRFGLRRTLRHVAGTAVGVGALVLGSAAGLGVVILAIPGAELVLKLAGSAYLLYLALRIAGYQPFTSRSRTSEPAEDRPASDRADASRPLGIWHAAAFQFANPKAWIFGLAVVSSFRPTGLPPAAAALAITAICATVILATATAWAAGGAALHRTLQRDSTQRTVSLTLAVILVASVALIWI